MNKKQELQDFLDVAFGRKAPPAGEAAAARRSRKPPTVKRSKVLAAAAREKKALDAEILDLEKKANLLRRRQSVLARQLTRGIEDFGVVPRKANQVVMAVEEHRAAKRWNGDAKVIDAERVGEIFPELKTTEDHLNLTVFTEMVRGTGSVKARKALAAFRQLLYAMERKAGTKFVEKVGDGAVDLTRYAQYKEDGRITPKQAEIFEHIEGPLEVKKIPVTCSRCGAIKDSAICRECGCK